MGRVLAEEQEEVVEEDSCAQTAQSSRPYEKGKSLDAVNRGPAQVAERETGLTPVPGQRGVATAQSPLALRQAAGSRLEVLEQLVKAMVSSPPALAAAGL